MIYGPLQENRSIVQLLFADRWQQFISFGRLSHDFTIQELRRAFDLMISDPSKKFFFLVDALDEVKSSSPESIVELLIASARRDNVKICASSRSLPGFQRPLEDAPSLKVDAHVDKDVQNVIRSMFGQSEKIARIRNELPETKLESNIFRDIGHKASGDFLFAKLATDLILQGLGDTDDLWSVQRQVGK